MFAARYLGPDRLETLELATPSISDEEALIKVEACGFCGSDLGIVAGVHPRAREPLTLGHEFSGTIAEIRTSSSEFNVGDRVTVFPLISCGHCFACRSGQSHVCRTLKLYGFDVDGAMAQFVRVAVSSLLKLPHPLPPFVGAVVEPLAVAVHGVSMAPEQDVKTVVVLGAGPIGLLTALVASSEGDAKVLISDVLPSRLDLARRLGLTAFAAGEELKSAVHDLTGDEGVDLVYECAGAPSSAVAMTALLRSRGTVINLGVFKKPVSVDMQAINFKELTVRGSRVYARRDFDRAIELAGTLPIRQVVTHTFPLMEVQAAFDCFRKGNGVCKVLILPNGSPA
ncbi:MAG TPA: alcohol dehydrogenase catalytic domain-containing protein [Terracidiphilus sp.]|jgi:2-desacetyl-2-hydroxyethyl bacteriochlorophyllide A dehydrogenase|nr:alcohol dehydrogenase catalytic domain-containing protein [Terracidiphilus sp.]